MNTSSTGFEHNADLKQSNVLKLYIEGLFQKLGQFEGFSNELSQISGLDSDNISKFLEYVRGDVVSFILQNIVNEEGNITNDKQKRINQFPITVDINNFNKDGQLMLVPEGKEENGITTKFVEKINPKYLAQYKSYKWIGIIASRLFRELGFRVMADQSLAYSALNQYVLDGSIDFDKNLGFIDKYRDVDLSPIQNAKDRSSKTWDFYFEGVFRDLECAEQLDQLESEVKMIEGLDPLDIEKLKICVRENAMSLVIGNIFYINTALDHDGKDDPILRDRDGLIGHIPGGDALAHFSQNLTPNPKSIVQNIGYKWSGIIASRIFDAFGFRTKSDQALAKSVSFKYLADETITSYEFVDMKGIN